jgi:hypothetical protein
MMNDDFPRFRLSGHQCEHAALLRTFLEFPPMQRGASFNLDAVKAEIDSLVHPGRLKRTDEQTITFSRKVVASQNNAPMGSPQAHELCIQV